MPTLIKDIEKFQKRFNKEYDNLSEKDILNFIKTYMKLNNTSRNVKNKINEIKSSLNNFRENIIPELSEIISCVVLTKIFKMKDISYKINSTRFPDIVIDDTGFEVKKMASLKTGSLGNSVLQEDPGMNDIYTIIFSDSNDEVIIVRYEDLIASVKVDHNPRFYLSLRRNKDFRELFGISLQEFLHLELIDKSELLKKYLRKNVKKEDMWLWYMGIDDIEAIQNFADNMVEKWKKLNKKELMIRFFAEKPEFIKERNKNSLRNYVIKKYKCYGPVKDIFTAGKNKNEKFPKLFSHLLDNLNDIIAFLNKKNINIKEWKERICPIIRTRINKPRNANRLTKKQAEIIIESINNA